MIFNSLSIFKSEYYTALQSQKAVTAYFKSKQLLPLGFSHFISKCLTIPCVYLYDIGGALLYTIFSRSETTLFRLRSGPDRGHE